MQEFETAKSFWRFVALDIDQLLLFVIMSFQRNNGAWARFRFDFHATFTDFIYKVLIGQICKMNVFDWLKLFIITQLIAESCVKIVQVEVHRVLFNNQTTSPICCTVGLFLLFPNVYVHDHEQTMVEQSIRMQDFCNREWRRCILKHNTQRNVNKILVSLDAQSLLLKNR